MVRLVVARRSHIRKKAVARHGWADDGLDVAKAMIGVERVVNTAVDADLHQTVFSEELGEIFLLGLGN